MNAGDSQSVHHAVEHRAVAETHNRFGMFPHFGEIQMVDDADAAVTASRQPDGVDVVAVEIFLEHGGAECVGAGEDMVHGEKTFVVNRVKPCWRSQFTAKDISSFVTFRAGAAIAMFMLII